MHQNRKVNVAKLEKKPTANTVKIREKPERKKITDGERNFTMSMAITKGFSGFK